MTVYPKATDVRGELRVPRRGPAALRRAAGCRCHVYPCPHIAPERYRARRDRLSRA